MEKYKCAVCERELDISMAQITATKKVHGQLKIVGNLCCACENKPGAEIIEVYVVGAKGLGWYTTDRYDDAFDSLMIEIDNNSEEEWEIYRDYMLKADFENMPEFEGF